MLATRIKTAVLLGLVLALVLFVLPNYCWVIFCSALVGVAFWEWLGLTPKPYLTGRKRIAVAVGLVLVLAGCALAPAIVWMVLDSRMAANENVLALRSQWRGFYDFFLLVGGEIVLVSGFFWLLLVPLWLARQWRLNNALLHFLVGLLLVIPAWVVLVLIGNNPKLLFALAIPWIADIGAYFVGRRFGKHKLAPSISPGKSWEGVAGAAVCLLIYGLVLQQFTTELPTVVMLPAVLLFLAVSVLGDLFESLMKRQAGVKDSSNLLPGHGGVLDRIDSQLAVLPVLAICVVVPLFLVFGMFSR